MPISLPLGHPGLRTATMPMVVLLTMVGQGSASAQNPPTNTNVSAELKVGANGSDQVILVTNRSDQSIIVNSVTLKDCKNVQGSCSTRRLNVRVYPGTAIPVHRIRQRYPDQEFWFQYTFSWTTDQPIESQPGPAIAIPLSQADGIADQKVREKVKAAIETEAATPAAIDTVTVTPGQLTLKVGQRVELGQALGAVARSSDGTAILGVKLRVSVEVGQEHARLENGGLVGLKPGTALLLIAPPLPPDTKGEAKGASRVIIRVVP